MVANPLIEREERYGAFLIQQLNQGKLNRAFLEQMLHHFSVHRYCFETVAERTDIHFMRATVVWVLQEWFDLANETVDDLILVYEEVVANVLRHSYQAHEAKWLRYCLIRDQRDLILTVVDRGAAGRNPALVERFASISREGRPPLQHRGGLGLYLMKRIMDEIEYHPGGPENIITMRKVCFA
ncbi:MAG: ATP-binding protein [Deltaproteobacteria bacterium]|nr:MAG: ATP-binding protein [Deltaproteobacteria bacterium]